MHGPGWPSWEPMWDRTIPVLDTIAMSLRPRRMTKWRAARDAGLAKWAPTGLMFTVLEQTPHGYPQLDGARLNEPGYIDTMLVPSYLRIMRAAPEATRDGFAWWVWPQSGGDPKAAAAFIKMGPAFWLRSFGSKAYVIGHEVGHCLGLSHRPAGSGPISAGIMGTGTNPDAHDLESIRNWYFS